MSRKYSSNMIKKTNIALVGFPQAIFIQDLKNQIDQDHHDITVITPDDFLSMNRPAHDGYMIGVTRDMTLRASLVEHGQQHGFPGFTFVHPSAVIFPDAAIGTGCFVGPFAFVASRAKIDDHCLINPYAMVSHVCHVGQGSVLHPGTMVAGTTSIGKYCKFNLKSAMLDDLTMADFTEIGASGLVTKNIVEPHGFYVGSPARRQTKPD
jgi:UDP-3-O-[3-hydroxymyristoyl] glucosamine N-acyltransferase